MTALALKDLKKSYAKVDVIKGVDLAVGDGEFVVFVGPSGCGKSTLLRMIAGLEEITSGELRIGDQPMNDVPPAKRGVAMVFQSYALYPHLTVRDNIGFGLKVRKMPGSELSQRVEEAARSLQLDQLMDRYPRELSGGQRQRVAIGRAIVANPDVFLFDEPLSNLDAELRVHMRSEIAALHSRLKSTMIYVTHDQVEAMTLADKIVVLRAGKIEQVGTPKQLYERPDNVFVAQFIGSPKMNLLEVSGLDKATLNQLAAPTNASQIGIRPEHVTIIPQGEKGLMSAHVESAEYLGAQTLLHLVHDSGVRMLVLADEELGIETGSDIQLGAASKNIHWFDKDGLRITVA